MTKEEALKKVDTAYQIYELLKAYPVNERHHVLTHVEQFNQADWNKHHEAEKAQYAASLNSLGPKVRPF